LSVTITVLNDIDEVVLVITGGCAQTIILSLTLLSRQTPLVRLLWLVATAIKHCVHNVKNKTQISSSSSHHTNLHNITVI
jgi:hypothetical protein